MLYIYRLLFLEGDLLIYCRLLNFRQRISYGFNISLISWLPLHFLLKYVSCKSIFSKDASGSWNFHLKSSCHFGYSNFALDNQMDQFLPSLDKEIVTSKEIREFLFRFSCLLIWCSLTIIINNLKTFEFKNWKFYQSIIVK